MAGPFRRTRHALAYILAKSFLTVVQITPRSIMLPISALMGMIMGVVLVPTRREIMKNLDHVFGDRKTLAEKKKICRRVFVNLGLTACDAIKVPSLSEAEFKKIVKTDLTAVHKALDVTKSGAVVAGGHFSCFELQSHLFAMDGRPVVVIGAELFDKGIDREVEKLRTRNGILYLTRNGASRRLIKELKEGRIFVSLIDQDATSDGVFAKFLGHLAFTPSGPIRIAIRYGVPLFFFHLERQKDFTYQFHIEGPIAIPDVESNDEKRLILAQQFNDFIAAQIEKCPDQWVWMHQRWKRQRADFPDILSITDYEATK